MKNKNWSLFFLFLFTVVYFFSDPRNHCLVPFMLWYNTKWTFFSSNIYILMLFWKFAIYLFSLVCCFGIFMSFHWVKFQRIDQFKKIDVLVLVLTSLDKKRKWFTSSTLWIVFLVFVPVVLLKYLKPVSIWFIFGAYIIHHYFMYIFSDFTILFKYFVWI